MQTSSDLPEYFSFSSSNPDETGLRLIALHDSRTGFTLRTALADDKRQIPAIMAFAGARFSRSADTAEDIFKEINTGKKSAQEKLANIFNNYGHASVGDMAMLFAYIENVPRYLLLQFFHSTCLGGGQERSTRFGDFSKAHAPNISLFIPAGANPAKFKKVDKRYQESFQKLLSLYQKYLPIVHDALTEAYKPDPAIKANERALQARTFDTARAFLPAGANTSGAYITSAREWARLASEFSGSPFFEVQCLGQQIAALFAPPESVQRDLDYLPEAPDLLRHTAPDTRQYDLLPKLVPLTRILQVQISGRGKFPQYRLQKVRHLAQQLNPASAYLYFSLLRLYPMLTIGKFTIWYETLSDYTKKRLSNILFKDFDHHNQIPLFGRTGGYTFELKLALSEMIDFNRHRAWGRFTPFLETADVPTLIRDGFQLPLYLDHRKLSGLKQEFLDEFNVYYEQLLGFSDSLPKDVSPRLLLSLLPNAHSVRFYLSGGARELSYFPQLRVRPGGHINYRVLAYDLAQQASKIDPLLQGVKLPIEKKPDPLSREEFFDRS